jgi:hypothetical protein
MVDLAHSFYISINRLLKTSLFLFLLLYLSGRATLIIHEFLGHALPVILLGHGIHDITFQFFGDAWINYHYLGSFDQVHETIILAGGVISEILVALILLISSRWFQIVFLRFIMTFFAAILMIHALHYSILGLYFEYGDGRYFNHLWGEGSPKLIAWCLFIPLTLFCYEFSKEFSQSITSLFPTKPLMNLGLSSILAIGAHLVLIYSEQQLMFSQTHHQIFQPQHIADILQEFKEKEPFSLTKEQKQTIIQKHTPFDLKWVLYPMIISSMLLGYFTSEEPPFYLDIKKLHLVKLFAISIIVFLSLFVINFIV